MTDQSRGFGVICGASPKTPLPTCAEWPDDAPCPTCGGSIGFMYGIFPGGIGPYLHCVDCYHVVAGTDDDE